MNCPSCNLRIKDRKAETCPCGYDVRAHTKRPTASPTEQRANAQHNLAKIKRDLRGGGVVLVLAGLSSLFQGQGFYVVWGALLIALGVFAVASPRPGMALSLAILFAVLGVLNMVASGTGGLRILGGFQLLVGAYVFRSFLMFRGAEKTLGVGSSATSAYTTENAGPPCPKCQKLTRLGDSFCEACGNPLARTQPSS